MLVNTTKLITGIFMVSETWKKKTPIINNKEIGKEFMAYPIDGILCSQ